jgi:tryptophan synthase alpha chain
LIWTGHAGSDPTISPEHFETCMRDFKAISPLPILASMKVADAETAHAVTRHCDGILVGSALVWLIEGRGPKIAESLGNFVKDLREGIDG